MWCPKGKYPRPGASNATIGKRDVRGPLGRGRDEAKRARAGKAVAAPMQVCADTEYCCPDAKHCLTATKTSCLKDASACASGEVCCPVTKLCVKPGAPCNTTCHAAGNKWGVNDYCSPTQQYPGFESHWCATPTDPGVLCSSDSDCINDKWSNAKCDAVTNLCVTIREACQLA